MNFWLRTTFVTLLISLFAGCATTYRVQVDALASPEASNVSSFVIEQPKGGEAGSRLRYQEAANYISKALLARGWQATGNADEADVVISLNASVSEPMTETQLRSEPLYFRSWGHTRYVRTAVRDSSGKVVKYVRSEIYTPPRTHFAGYQDVSYTTTVYKKSLELTARDEAGEELWTISMQTIDQSSDLRSYIPLLAAAALPYIGETTEGEIVVKIRDDDETLAHLRGLPTE